MAIALAPCRSEFYVNLAAVYLLQGRTHQALVTYQQAAERDPRSLAIMVGYANCLMKLGEHDQALQVLQRLPDKYQGDERVCMLACQICHEVLRLEEAEMYISRLLQRVPDHVGAHYRMGLLAMYAGHFEKAASQARRAIALDPGYADAYKLLADIRKFSDKSDPDLLAMLDLYQQVDPDSEDRVTLAFSLGKVMHDLKQYDRAFRFFEEGNALRRQSFAYHHADTLALIRNAILPDAVMPTHASRDPDDATPIFIVGMPRCGSTLVEQILSAHPDVQARGECNAFRLAAESVAAEGSFDSMLRPADMAGYSDQQWRAVGDACLARLCCGGAAFVTDKTLPNIAWIGAIHAALPHARIIHVRRNPLDNCLSIYRTNLQGSDFQFGFDLHELGEYYAAYRQLMQQWRRIFPDGVMYELDYEQLVADQRGETRKLLEACGLSWHETCLQFNKESYGVLTASAVQVRSGINTDSLAAWKRYEKHLQPLIRLLGEPA